MWVVSIAHECEVRQVVFLMKPISIDCVHEHKMEAQWLWSAIVPHIITSVQEWDSQQMLERGNCARVYYNIHQKLATDCIFSDFTWRRSDYVMQVTLPCSCCLQTQCTITNFWGIHMHTFNSTTACFLFHFLRCLWYAGQTIGIPQKMMMQYAWTAKRQFFSIFEPVEIDVPVS